MLFRVIDVRRYLFEILFVAAEVPGLHLLFPWFELIHIFDFWGVAQQNTCTWRDSSEVNNFKLWCVDYFDVHAFVFAKFHLEILVELTRKVIWWEVLDQTWRFIFEHSWRLACKTKIKGVKTEVAVEVAESVARSQDLDFLCVETDFVH